MEDFVLFQEKVKNSFQKVKEHISGLEAEIKQNKSILEDLKDSFESFKSAHLTTPKEEVSIGNQGVANSQQQPTDDNRQQQTMPKSPEKTLNSQQQPTLSSLSELKQTLDSAFQTLTDREFSVFMALYSLDREGVTDIGYYELSHQLNIAESTVRDFINILIRKNIPIQKDRFFNRKVSLSVKEEFKHLDLYQTLLRLKTQKQGQRTLFDL